MPCPMEWSTLVKHVSSWLLATVGRSDALERKTYTSGKISRKFTLHEEARSRSRDQITMSRLQNYGTNLSSPVAKKQEGGNTT